MQYKKDSYYHQLLVKEYGRKEAIEILKNLNNYYAMDMETMRRIKAYKPKDDIDYSRKLRLPRASVLS